MTSRGESRGAISCGHCFEVLVPAARQARGSLYLAGVKLRTEKNAKIKRGKIVLTNTKHLFSAAGAVDNIFCFPRFLQCGYITLQEGYIFISKREKSIFGFCGKIKHKIVILKTYSDRRFQNIKRKSIWMLPLNSINTKSEHKRSVSNDLSFCREGGKLCPHTRHAWFPFLSEKQAEKAPDGEAGVQTVPNTKHGIRVFVAL